MNASVPSFLSAAVTTGLKLRLLYEIFQRKRKISDCFGTLLLSCCSCDNRVKLRLLFGKFSKEEGD